MKTPALRLRPFLDSLEAYTPGEQLAGHGIVKLNTNENPYPPDPAVLAEIASAAGRLHLYPNPTCQPLRRALAAYHTLSIDQVLVGNGSDEILRLLIQAFIAPDKAIAVVEPSYSLYPVLSAWYEGTTTVYPLRNRQELPEELFGAPEPILLLPNPNPPLGTLFTRQEIARLCEERADRLVVIDEAYVDFATRDAVPLLGEYANLAITRTFSKSFSLAGARVGYVLASVELIAALMKIKDSYNVNLLSQVAAGAAIAAYPTMRANAGKIVAERVRTTEALRGLGYEVPESQGNFVFAIHPEARQHFEALRAVKILVRYFDAPLLRDGMRISIGMPEQMDRVIEVLTKAVKKPG